MTLTLGFRFVSGRYHATPYGHHVNEGLIEWPPSPWRLLRSLISVGYTSGVWNGDGPNGCARSLIESLSQELPEYYLPEAIGTHSRHFMPKGVLDTGIEKTTLVFDTWARLNDQELLVAWPSKHLSHDEASLLHRLLGNLNYLGRSESWVEARIIPSDEKVPEFNCVPDDGETTPNRDQEQVALLTTTGASEYLLWRNSQLERLLANPDLQPLEGRKPSKALEKKQARAVEPYPTDLLACLQKDTSWLRKHGWSQPPGSRKAFYLRPSSAISIGTSAAKARYQSKSVSATLLSLTNASRNDHALPSVTRTLPQGELLHSALVGIATGLKQGEPPIELIGKDESGLPLRGPHEHAHIHPLDLDADGHLDHILIWAAMGLSANAQYSIRAARKTFAKGGLEDLRLAVSAIGAFADLAGVSGKYGARLERIVGRAEIWRSLTPFVASRHIKRRGKNTIEGQIASELESRNLPHAKSVEVSSFRDMVAYGQFRHFVLSRRKGPQPPKPIGYAVEIEFSQPIDGPLALGYASHFGLGLFVAATK